MEGETEAVSRERLARGPGCSRRAATASGAPASLGPPLRPGTAQRPALRAKTNTSHKRPLCGRAPHPPAPRPPGQSRLCARPAAPAAQAILISVWVCAGDWNQSPRSSSAPVPTPASRVPGAPRTPAGCGRWSLLGQGTSPLSLSFPVTINRSASPKVLLEFTKEIGKLVNVLVLGGGTEAPSEGKL